MTFHEETLTTFYNIYILIVTYMFVSLRGLYNHLHNQWLAFHLYVSLCRVDPFYYQCRLEIMTRLLMSLCHCDVEFNSMDVVIDMR